MTKERENPNVVPVNDEPVTDRKLKGPNRRQFRIEQTGLQHLARSRNSFWHPFSQLDILVHFVG